MAQWSEHWQLKSGALGSIPGGCPDAFPSSKLSDVARWGDVIYGALVQFGCYHHRDMYVYACRVLAIPLRVLICPRELPSVNKLNLTLMYP